MTVGRPRIVSAHWAGLDFITDAHAERIATVGDLVNRDPVASWDDPRVPALLAEADVILGHWGCPAIDADVLARSPRLGLIAYVAGTVKGVVTEAVWDRPIRVTSGAGANAEPVAEFTLAAMRTGATLINTARASVVDQDALVAELTAGRLYAVLDVVEPEPLPQEHVLRRLPTVFFTPHLAGSEGTELDRMVDHAVDEIHRWRVGLPARNEITRERLAFIA